MTPARRDARGFRIFAEFRESRRVSVCVKESSADPLGKWLWVFVDDTGSEYSEQKGMVAVHLTRVQARKLRNAIDAWLKAWRR